MANAVKFTVDLTMGKIYGAIATLLCGGGAILWAVLTFTIGGLRNDVADIRASVGGLNSSDKETIRRTGEIEAKLGDQINGLKVELVGFSGKMDSVANKLEMVSTTLTTRLESVSASLTTVNASLANVANRFEKFQDQLAYAQQASYDPKRAALFAQYLKENGLDQEKIVVVPLYGPVPFLQKPN